MASAVTFSHSLHLQQISHRSKKYISSICVAEGNVWVGTVGEGLWVYEASTKLPIAVWGGEEKHQIYMVLYIEETSRILTLTHRGIFVFASDLPHDDPTSMNCDVLTPTHCYPRVKNDINQGVVIPPLANMDSGEVWVCSQTGLGFQIFNPLDCRLKEEVLFPENTGSQGRKIRHLEPLVVSGRSVLAVADRHYVQKWDVKCREKREEFDCFEACKHIYGSHATPGKLYQIFTR